MARHGEVVGFADGILYVEVSDPAWLRQMSSIAQLLSNEVARIAGIPVREIHFETGRGDRQ